MRNTTMNNKKFFLQSLIGDSVDLATSALLVARHFQPQINLEDEIQHIEELASAASVWPVTDPTSLIEFFTSNGFKGNQQDYYHIDNSLLNQVLSSRKGIPISLAVVYLAVIERLQKPDLTAHGVSFPGHFLLSVNHGSTQQLVDVFDARPVTQEQCYQRFTNTDSEPNPTHFQSATTYDILCRLLENLKVIHWKSGDTQTVLDCLDYQLMIFPQSNRLLTQQHEFLTSIKRSGNSDSDNIQMH